MRKEDIYHQKTLCYFMMFLLSSVLGAVFVPVLTFYLTPQELGMFSVANVTIMLITGLFHTAVMSGVLRHYPIYQRDNREGLFVKGVFILLLNIVLLVLVIWFSVLFNIKMYLSAPLYQAFVIGAWIAVTTIFWRGLVTFFQAQENAGLYSLFVGTEAVVRYIISIFLLILGIGIFSPFIGFLISSILFSIIIAARFFKSFLQPKSIKTLPVMAQMIRYGYPFMLSALSMWLLSSSDTYMLAFLKGKTEVGLYTVGYVIPFQAITIVTMSILTTMEPALMNTWEKEGKEKTIHLLNMFSKQIFLIGIPIIVGGTILSQNLIQVFTSADYQESYIIFGFVVTGGFFWALYKLAYSGLYLMKKTKTIAVLLFISGMINIILNLLIIPVYGYSGAAVTTMISYISLFLLARAVSQKYIKFTLPYTSLKVSIIGSVIMGMILFLTNFGFNNSVIYLILQIFTGMISYFAILYYMGQLKYFPYGESLTRVFHRILPTGGRI